MIMHRCHGKSRIPLFAVLLIITAMAMAEEESSPKLDISGSLLTDHRAKVGGESVVYNWQEYRMSLRGEYKLPGKSRFYSETWVRSIGFPVTNTMADIQSFRTLSPLETVLREAYADIYNCGIDKLDLRIGRQRIAWGTGDKINPTDNFDPDDLEDIWDFGRHLSSDALKAAYYIGDYSLSGVFIPQFRPALLPQGEWLAALMPSQELPPELASAVTIKSMNEHFSMPSQRPEESSSGGLKLGGRIAGYDVSLSYAYTRDHFPVVSEKALTPATTNLLTQPLPLYVDVTLTYPRQQVAGIDFAGAIASVGVWAEAGVFFPEKVVTTTVFNGQMPTPQEIAMLPPALQAQAMALSLMLGEMAKPAVALDDKPYVKYVVGADYTFPANIYGNLQYVHGFVHERGDSLEDYLMGTLDWKLLNEKLVLSPLGIGLEIKDWSKIGDNYAFIGQPKIVWKPVDNAELSIGGRIITGTKATQFGRLRDNDEVFGVMKYSF